jgi:hypothetical protein
MSVFGATSRSPQDLAKVGNPPIVLKKSLKRIHE